ncbi:MAG: hypothetical protein GY722_12695, partial [bacterium]|nr:hypothetical protein [bacterium]
DRVLSAARVQGPGLVVQLGEYLSPALNDGETLPDVGSLIELYARRLQGLGAWKR